MPVPDGALRRSKDGRSEGLDLELIVAGGKYAKRKLWTLLTLQGEDRRARRGRTHRPRPRCAQSLSSRAVSRPDDKSEAAKQARCISSYLDLDGMQFVGAHRCRAGTQRATRQRTSLPA